MRRNLRKKGENKSMTDKIIMYCGIGVAILTVIVLGLLIYSKILSDDVKNGTMTLEQMANIAENATQNDTMNNQSNTESVSTEIGKTVEESENETKQSSTNANKMANQTKSNTANTSANTSKNTTSSSTKTQKELNTVNNTANETNNSTNANNNTDSNSTSNQEKNKATEEVKKEWNFEKPVEGEIIREFAKDSLVYSETLEEWVTHTGIDIKAEKTTIVKAAESGTIKSIKNDPRYGLTIVIEHDSSYQTVYSNLLTSEFVVEGEKVEKGQAIGTVGNTAVFEIADEPHLHFEILKDSTPIKPEF